MVKMKFYRRFEVQVLDESEWYTGFWRIPESWIDLILCLINPNIKVKKIY